MITTRGASASSPSVNSRPAIRGRRKVRKYPGVAIRMLASVLLSGLACSGQYGRVNSDPIVLIGNDVTAATDSIAGTSRSDVSTRR